MAREEEPLTLLFEALSKITRRVRESTPSKILSQIVKLTSEVSKLNRNIEELNKRLDKIIVKLK